MLIKCTLNNVMSIEYKHALVSMENSLTNEECHKLRSPWCDEDATLPNISLAHAGFEHLKFKPTGD